MRTPPGPQSVRTPPALGAPVSSRPSDLSILLAGAQYTGNLKKKTGVWWWFCWWCVLCLCESQARTPPPFLFTTDILRLLPLGGWGLEYANERRLSEDASVERERAAHDDANPPSEYGLKYGLIFFLDFPGLEGSERGRGLDWLLVAETGEGRRHPHSPSKLDLNTFRSVQQGVP